jgi:hypothetical protein
MFNFIKKFFQKEKTPGGYATGPNTFAELMEQFKQPPKTATKDEIIQKYCIQVALYQHELEMLKMDSSQQFMGSRRSYNNDGTMDIDFVPCVIRPEVIYCSYAKN